MDASAPVTIEKQCGKRWNWLANFEVEGNEVELDSESSRIHI